MCITKTDSQRTSGYQWEVKSAEGQAVVGDKRHKLLCIK